jgi:hypothetical protein
VPVADVGFDLVEVFADEGDIEHDGHSLAGLELKANGERQ